jgi:predicted transcriptional regulator
MVSYMKHGGAVDECDPDFDPDFDAGYTQADVDRCARIVDDLLAALERAPAEKKQEFILKAMKSAVVKLNKLNDRCDGQLIETDQREQLCELMITAAQRAGLVSTVYDITEEWREW